MKQIESLGLAAQSHCDSPAHIWEAFEFGKVRVASQSLMGNSCVKQSVSLGPASGPWLQDSLRSVSTEMEHVGSITESQSA